ncbi:ATPase protein [Halorhabdus tiamatea SARL4B]|uniref:ATPase protein n=1 Tax=Halorhabdus tiamatea SARL4B TaxID=1033806 RepID=F7PHV2_9EURY|nr:hypothetical protein [Halorhabdus tiamatea]ERJ06946.1 ATPase protein [Halorhabdus tiamatea SARL4B]CCQ32353.1 CobQ/CobB/MinD/ParA nucleotide binding domain protein [Halorhabdus tiamatea SARL4B]
MLAVAGTKGGCGKTTVAIGIAEAFARADVPSVVVDADRQLPNLHVIGDVDRDPTSGRVPDAEDPSTVAVESPREPTARLLPAPLPDEDVSVDAVLARLAESSRQTIVDCPSGAGPDAVDPLSAADRAIVVTTTSSHSIEAATATVDMASHLDVPVAGLVVNQSERVPPSLVEATDRPVLGTIPDRASPLTHPDTCDAYDHIAAELTNRWPVTDGTTVAADRQRTGLDALDAGLGGGIPHGSVVAVIAEPSSQAEQFLYALTDARGTLYLTVERSPSLVRDSIESAAVPTGDPTIRRLDPDEIYTEATGFLETIPDGANLVIDPIDAFERTDREQYRRFMNGLLEHVRETESVAFVHCLDSEEPPSLRPLTVHFSDLVFEFEASMSVAGMAQCVTVPKVRGEPVPAATIELDLIDESVIPSRLPSHSD